MLRGLDMRGLSCVFRIQGRLGFQGGAQVWVLSMRGAWASQNLGCQNGVVHAMCREIWGDLAVFLHESPFDSMEIERR